jgi:tetratricopeptide (TPR) repeat protein
VSWLNQGIALGNLGKYDEATQAFDKAIEINPQYEAVWYLKGAALDQQGKYDEAIRAYDNSTQIDPQNCQ